MLQCMSAQFQCCSRSLCGAAAKATDSMAPAVATNISFSTIAKTLSIPHAQFRIPASRLGLGTVFFRQGLIFHTLPPEDQYFGVSHMGSLVPADACFAHATEAKTRFGLSRAMTHDFQFSNHMENQRTRKKRALQRRRVMNEGFLVWFAKDEHVACALPSCRKKHSLPTTTTARRGQLTPWTIPLETFPFLW